MGSSRWDYDDWKSYSRSTSTKTKDEIFDKKKIDPSLDPKGVKVRESRDSALNPQSNAIILALDITGSMGILADVLAREKLGVLVEEILGRKPVTDPHIMIMGIGDANYDSAPLQVSQFEADIRIALDLEKLFLEKGGGGNNFESYNLPWYFAAMHTAIDCFEKRNKKGYLFTIGDEEPPPSLLAQHISEFIGDTPQYDLLTADLLMMVSRMYEVFHVIVEEGDYASHHLDRVISGWVQLLGQKVLRLSDHTKLSEVIVSAIEVNEGRDADKVAASWSGDTSLVVRHAITGLTKQTKAGTGVVRF